MSKRLLWALLLIAVSAIVLIMNTGDDVAIFLLPRIAITTVKALAFLIFIATGVVIGVLLK